MTKTPNVKHERNPFIGMFRNRGGKIETGSFAFDSSYPIGGETAEFSFTPNTVSIPSQEGYVFEYDYTNEKVKAYVPGQSLIVEEEVTVATNVGNLAHLPFYILAIEATTATTTGPFNAIPTGKTPLTTECAVTFTTGALTFVSTDVVTVCKVTYIPIHSTGPFVSANLVIDEAVVAAAAKTDLAYQAAAVQYVYDGTGGSRMALEPVGEAPTASGNAVIDIDDGSNDTNIDVHADDEGNALVVTYIKYSALAAWQQLGDADLSLSSEIYNFTTNNYNFIAIPGLGTQLVGEATATNVELIWSGPGASVGAGVPTLDFEKNQWSTNESGAVTTLAVPIIFLSTFIQGAGLLEVGGGADLSGLTDVRYTAIGW